MSYKKEIGRWGEDQAVAQLTTGGYTILARNWVYGKEEIDIIASKDNLLVIVEVKTREPDAFIHPQDIISRAQQKRLINAAEAYILENDIDMETRFDLIAIELSHSGHKINHIEGAFFPTL